MVFTERIESELANYGSAHILVIFKIDVTNKEIKDCVSRIDSACKSKIIQKRLESLRSCNDRRKKIKAVTQFKHLRAVSGYANRRLITSFTRNRAVKSISSIPRVSLTIPQSTSAANDGTRINWGLRRLKIHKLWELGYKGSGVKVGHLDSGVYLNHPSLRSAIVSYQEFNSFGRPVNTSEYSDSSSDGHGTHTAGTIAGRAVAHRNIGVAPESEVYSAMVIPRGRTGERVINGINWLLSKNVKIINLSFGFSAEYPGFIELFRRLRELSILPVVAIGNDGPGTSDYPGSYIESLSVGAMDFSNNVPDFSSSERFERPVESLVPDLIAPGVGIRSAKKGGGYNEMKGTSMAAPHITGLAALLLNAKPSATDDELENAIRNSCKKLPNVPNWRQGLGVPDAVKALEIILS